MLRKIRIQIASTELNITILNVPIITLLGIWLCVMATNNVNPLLRQLNSLLLGVVRVIFSTS